MTGSEPFNKTMEAMNRTMDEVEAILEKKGSQQQRLYFEILGSGMNTEGYFFG